MKQKIKELNIPAQYERMVKKINDLSSPINADRVSAWEKSLSEHDMKKLEYISEKIGNNYGYNSKKTLSFFTKISYAILQLPDYIRVKSFEKINSPKIHFYFMYKNRTKTA